MNNILKDIAKAANAIQKNQSPLDEARHTFHSGKRLDWLDKFSAKTFYDYETWHNVCISLLSIGIVPDLQTLNRFSKLALYCDLSADELIKVTKGEPIGR
jgi:hypothetical protein